LLILWYKGLTFIRNTIFFKLSFIDFVVVVNRFLNQWQLAYHQKLKQVNIKQEAQWACIAHLVFVIYIPLSIYDQRMLHGKYLWIYWAPKGASPFI